MRENILALGIAKEFEGEGDLWFDLADPVMLVNYLRDNIEIGEEKVVKLKTFTPEEFEALE